MKNKKTSLDGCMKFLFELQRFLKPDRFLKLER